MRKERLVEIAVGLFMLAGMAALVMLALRVSGLTSYKAQQSFQVAAHFTNVGGLKPRAAVTIAGVKVGQVMNIRLDSETFKAVVTMAVDKNNNTLPVDSTASILTLGLLGANYISLTPGFEEDYLADGDTIDITNPAIILENLIGQFLYSTGGSKKDEKVI